MKRLLFRSSLIFLEKRRLLIVFLVCCLDGAAPISKRLHQIV